MHPIILKTHFLTLYSYGLCVALAMALAMVFALRQSARAGVSANDAMDLLFVLFVSGLVGSRMAYVVQNRQDFSQDWSAALRIQEGGLVWYGGFLLAVLCGVLYCRWKKQSVLRWADILSPVVAASHAVGRIGCFLNGCCYGRATDGLFGVRFPDETFRRHPVQLYESALLAALALVLLAVGPRMRRPGQIAGLYLFFYGWMRFGLEFLRDDQPQFYHLSLPQWISMGLLAVSFFFLRGIRAKK